MSKKKLKKARLVRRYLEFQSAKDAGMIFGKRQRGVGIYVLYKGNEVYYIGKSNLDARRRVRQHKNLDRHKGKWNKFSYFQITKPMFLRDLETLLIHICNPRGNRKKQHFKRARSIT